MSFLETERLYLEGVNSSHCTAMYCSWLNDPEVNKYLETGLFPYTLEKLSDYIKGYSTSNTAIFLALHLKENNQHIGNIKIEPINYIHKTAEYGILIGEKSCWNKGYAKEASQAVFMHCFNALNIRKITLGVIEDNEGAVLLYKKMGFEVEGLYRKHVFKNGEYKSVLRMALFNPNQG